MVAKKILLLVYVCCALLFMQFSGIHIHIDLDSSDKASIHQLNLYDVKDHVSDHDTDIDLDIFELNTNWSKVFQYFVVSAFLLLGVFAAGKYFWPPPLLKRKLARKYFWRPVLRAPPKLSCKNL